METSSPEKVLMNAAKAPAQVIPLMDRENPVFFPNQNGQFKYNFLSGPFDPVAS